MATRLAHGRTGLPTALILSLALLLSGAAPTAVLAYNADTHYDWTYYLALQVGFTKRQAYQIASAAFAIDHDPDTGPMEATPGDAIYGARHPGLTGSRHNQIATIWTDFHALADENHTHDAELVESTRRRRKEALWRLAMEQGNPGPLLHYVQDYYAHNAWDSVRGHAIAGHLPDYLEHDRVKGKLMTADTLEWLERFYREYLGRTPRTLDRERIHAVFLELSAANPLPNVIHNYQDATEPLAWAYDRISPFPFEVAEIIRKTHAPTYDNAHPVLVGAIRKDQADQRLPVWPKQADAIYLVPVKWFQYDFDATGHCYDKTYPVERPHLTLGQPRIELRAIDPNNYSIRLSQPYTLTGLVELRDHAGAPFLDPLPVLETHSMSDARVHQTRREITRSNGAHAVEDEIQRGRSALADSSLVWTVEIQAYGIEPEVRRNPVRIQADTNAGAIAEALSGLGMGLTVESHGSPKVSSVSGKKRLGQGPGYEATEITVRLNDGPPKMYPPKPEEKTFMVPGGSQARHSTWGPTPPVNGMTAAVHGGKVYPHANISAQFACGNLKIDVRQSRTASQGIDGGSEERGGPISTAIAGVGSSLETRVRSTCQAVARALIAREACLPDLSLAASKAVVQVAELQGAAEHWATGSTTSKPVQRGAVGRIGDRFRVGSGAWLKLQFRNGSTVTVAADSEVTIEGLAEPEVTETDQVALKIGGVTVRVPDTLRPRPDFRVRTPSTMVSVDGTVFTVRHDGNPPRTHVAVEQGEVRVEPDDPTAIPRLVRAGGEASVDGAEVASAGGRSATGGGGPVAGGPSGGGQIAGGDSDPGTRTPPTADPGARDGSPWGRPIEPGGNPASLTAAEILSGRWGGPNGGTYELTGGEFRRLDGIVYMRVSCTPSADKAVTPVFDCGGEWFDQRGMVAGGWRGKLYLLRGTNWYLDGQYNRVETAQDWYEASYKRLDEGPFEPSGAHAPASEPADDGASITAAEILSGRWGGPNGGTYELKGGEFRRLDGIVYMRLSCTPSADKAVSPVFDCHGDWYDQRGVVAGAWRGKLYLLRGTHWYLDGKYNSVASPADWYEAGYKKLEAEP